MNLNPDLSRFGLPATNLVERLRFWSEQRAQQPAFFFLDEQDEVTQVTYSQLDRQARAIAAQLTSLGFQGKRALLFFPPGLSFVAAFLGCLYAGTTAVPAFPPRRNRNMARVEAISGDAQAAVVLTVDSVLERSTSVLDDDSVHLTEIPWLAIERIPLDLADTWEPCALKDDTLAVLQYTSGSTGEPKGVMLSHSNLMHNCSIITHGFGANQESVGLSWLPTYHDMGLVGGILNPLFIGRPNVFMAPMSFLQKPIRWLRGISRFQVTISGGPNFAYALCNEKITDAECEGLDLSRWKVAFNGAEPVRADTLATFADKFGPFGFRAEAFYPCYGMAEATLIVSGAERKQPPRVRAFDANSLEANQVVPVSESDPTARKLVSSGRILPEQNVSIVDPVTCLASPENQVGEIWIQSKSVAQGYWNKADETGCVFHGTIANHGGETNRFLRSGDLGFFHEGELFVTGRSKDLIIINGRNLYPHDIESIVEASHEAIRTGGGVAFSVDRENSEQLVIAQELVREHRKYDLVEITAAIRKAVFEFLDVVPQSIVLLKVGRLPKTSSGKVQRGACRELYLTNQLEFLAQWPPTEVSIGQPAGEQLSSSSPTTATVHVGSPEFIQAWLVGRIADQLKTTEAKIDVNETFAHLGLDSVTLIGISGELEDVLGETVSPKLLFNYPTISELADFLSTDHTTEATDKSVIPMHRELESRSKRAVVHNRLDKTNSAKSVHELLAGIDNLSAAETSALLRELLEEKARQEITTYPLSHGQRALWFIYQMDPGSAAYNIMYAARVRADLDHQAFCRAFQSLLNRHEILRTTYALHDGTPLQCVRPFQTFDLQVVDARHWNQDELEAGIQTLADIPFDLKHGPVLRVHLLERTGAQHIMLFVVHHIAIDFWAFDLLLGELELFYREETTGEQTNLPVPKATYHDFVRWQEQILEHSEGERMWDYWQEELRGELPLLDLPTDFPRPRLQSFRGKSHPFRLPGPLTDQLFEFSKAQGVTLFTTCLAAFQVLLYRYCEQEDIVVGCPAGGRTRSEFEQVFGYFVNPIALRANLSADQSFTGFLQQVRETLGKGIIHQDYPFSLLVERLQAPRDASRSPVFQVAIGWNTPRRLDPSLAAEGNSDNQPIDPGSLGLEPFLLGQQGSAFDLMLMFLNCGDSVSGVIQYNVELFDESSIARMARHYQSICRSIADNPERSIGELPLLNSNEKQTLIETWNDTAAEYPLETCLHEMFEIQVAQTPEATAVECKGQSLTYRELNARANQVASHLIKLGVGPENLVAIYVDRSLEMMIGLLGILKSGGAYVPLSPGTPRQRLSLMFKQCQPSVVLTQQRLANDLLGLHGQLVCLDDDWTTIANKNCNNPIRRVRASNLAYVIFTSGSTGQPKGVEIEHRSVVNFLTSMKRHPGIDGGDVLLALTTYSFDIAVLELFLPLTVGARVVIVGDGIASDGIQLARELEVSGATMVQATPATWRLLVEAGWRGDPNLRALCGGEALLPDLADSLLTRCRSLWNMYGPTETTIWSAVDRVDISSNPIPIGRPIANTQIFILDPFMQPVPQGVKGDLYIGGDGLARGYLGQPEMTERTFVDSPFRPGTGTRLYKTGDLARFRTDGKIEFLGRRDYQAKVRGFRIELEEIEVQLSVHPQIRQAVVMATRSSSPDGDTRLVAYFTFSDEVPGTSELCDFLKLTLPDYMIPSVFVPLVEFPLNSAGKIDRPGLPEPDTARPELRAPYVAPRNSLESILSETWERVLGLDRVGINDNFFELGGASLQSLEIAALALESGIELLPAQLFQHPTVAELAASVRMQSPGAGQTFGTKVEEKVDPDIVGIKVTKTPNPRDNEKPGTPFPNIVIESLGVYLPPNSVATRDVVAGCTHKIWFPLENMTGIKSRRVSADDEFTSEIACNAVSECLEHSRYTPDQIDLVICCHIGRDEQPESAAIEPGTAMYVKQRFEFPNAIAFDINNACAGMFTGIGIAESYIRSGAARRVLVVSAEHISPVMRTAQREISGFMDPRIASLTLGDAGAAMILEPARGHAVGFEELYMYSLTQYSEMCIGKPTEFAHGGPILVVPDPIKHTSIAIKNSIAHAKSVLDRSHWAPEDIQWVIMHQTSERSLLDGARAINQAFKRKICTPANTINNLADRGNTASTSHFVAVWDNVLNGRIQAGDHVVFGITGSGQTIGTALYTFDDLPDRIRRRRASGTPVVKRVRVESPPNVACCRQRRIRIESLGVVAAEDNVALETIPLVTAAVNNCFQRSEYKPAEIDVVIFAGVYRTDFISEPALATMIAGKLKINDAVRPTDSQQTFAFDVINGGMGMMTACEIASRMIHSQTIQNALIIASEVENNRNQFPDDLIGIKETASAIILDRRSPARTGFGDFVFKYSPGLLDARKVTGQYTPAGPRIILEQDPNVAGLFLSIIPEAVNELLARERLSLSEIDIVLPPQFSHHFLCKLAIALNVPRDRFVDIVDEGQDWFTSSMPYSFHAVETRSLAQAGDIGLVVQVGAGLQVGCAIYRF